MQRYRKIAIIFLFAHIMTANLLGQCTKYELIHTLYQCNINFHSEKLVILDTNKQEILDREFYLVGGLALKKTNGQYNQIKIRSGYIIDSLTDVINDNYVMADLEDGNGSCTIGTPFNTLQLKEGTIKVESFEPVEPSCRPKSGCIILNGLAKGTHYDFYMNNSNQPIYKNIKTNEDGQIVILGQDAGFYKDIYIKSGGCSSNKGEMKLTEPAKPPTPWIRESHRSGEGEMTLMASGKGKMQWYIGDSLVQIGNIFKTPVLNKNTIYTVYANDDDCISKPQPVMAYVHEPLIAYKLSSEKNSTGGLHIFLEGSQKDVFYRLYLDEKIIKEVIGTGHKVDFGVHSTEGGYKAKAFLFEQEEKIQDGSIIIRN